MSDTRDFGSLAGPNRAVSATGADAAGAERSLPPHASGPWRLCFHLQSMENDASCSCGFRGVIWGSDDDHAICEMGSTEIPGQEGLNPPRYPRPVELANARLIAAGPDMLEALTACREELHKLRDGSLGGIPNSIVALIPECIERADAAIRKATEAA